METMNADLAALADTARIWIYQSERLFTPDEAEGIQSDLDGFTASWTAHNRALKAWGGLLHGLFVILAVDEQQAEATGCSIDRSVHFLRGLSEKYNADLFDRFVFSYRQPDGGIQTAKREDFEALYAKGDINDDTIVFNNLVRTVGDWRKGWEVRLGDSWHRNFVQQQ